MKILTILGTRPEIIRLSRIITKLDDRVDQLLVHTGQHAQAFLNEDFFKDLDIRVPDIVLEASASSLGEQIGKMMTGLGKVLEEHKPDKVLVLGDTNTSFAATFISERMGYPVFHMEAGNRCFDKTVPEEINRHAIDAIASVNLPYNENSKNHLLREGMSVKRIFKTGNPIGEVIWYYDSAISFSNILETLDLETKPFVLVTAHRAENVDSAYRLKTIFDCLGKISEKYKVIFSCHPRTRDKINKFDIKVSDNILLCDPFKFTDFARLQQKCKFAITDSGTVQEEMCIFRKPCITIRNSTERLETVLAGSNIVCGLEENKILEAYANIEKMSPAWTIPEEYEVRNVSEIVINILMQKIDYGY